MKTWKNSILPIEFDAGRMTVRLTDELCGVV